jgi:hypothetical protein
MAMEQASMRSTSDQPDSDYRELTDAELDQASGGLVVIAIIAILIGQLLPQ